MAKSHYCVRCQLADDVYWEPVFAESPQEAVDIIRRETKFVVVLCVAVQVYDWT